MGVRDDTPEDVAPGPPGDGHDGHDGDEADAPPRRDPQRKPLGYYYDDGTNYETYDPGAEDGPEGMGDEIGANRRGEEGRSEKC